MRRFDISMPITPSMTVYKDREAKKPTFFIDATHDKNGVYETSIKLNLHTGTHVDFAKHTLKDGKTSTDFDFNRLLGKAKVLDLSHVNDAITKADLLNHAIEEGDFILLKTRNSDVDHFDYDFVYLRLDAAQYLRDLKIRGVGIDALGIERAQENHPTHDTLLGADILILEGLRLKGIEAGGYNLLCLPLAIEDVEALPVRCLLEV